MRHAVSSTKGSAVLTLVPEPWEAGLLSRLAVSPTSEDTLLELYDRVAPDVWGYAVHRSRSRGSGVAKQVAINAFLTAAQHPAIFDDRRVPIRVRMLMLVHLDTAGYAVEEPTARERRFGRRKPVPLVSAAAG
jgi:hypothetical protein